MEKLAIITAMTRPQYEKRLADSFRHVSAFFDLRWMRIENLDKRMTIGQCINAAIEQMNDPQCWVYICDDDNEIHPDFGRALKNVLDTEVRNWPLLLCRQYEKTGKPRSTTYNPEQKIGKIDGGQAVFKAHLVSSTPWGTSMSCPDGIWFEQLLAKGIKGTLVEVPTYYNFNSGK